MKSTVFFEYKNQNGLSIGLFIVAIALAALGLAFINIANHSVTVQNYSEQWTKGTAKVTELALETRGSKDYPKITYDYTVNKEKFSGTRIFFSDGPYEKVEAFENGIRLEVFPPQGNDSEILILQKDADIDVYYNPHNPREAVLVRYALGEMKIFMIVGMFTTVIGLFLVAKSLFSESID